ncbi:MAG: DNA ligase D, partial [Candidatus Hydrogenedentes bacterium]|nr:DNA ligase D [Candidatus Hydrogenedentota bacterium]
MSLAQYRKKRNFSKTPEPEGEVKKRKTSKLRYVIQKHAASRLHYDFRLELGGALKSWAVPKGPSFDPKQRRLAVHVEDHPLDYGTFEGTIPQGQYGGGTVMVWDTGSWESDDGDPVKAYKSGKMKFHLQGEKLKGGWTLVRMQTKDEKGDNWLLIKERDEFATSKGDVTEDYPDSAVTERDIEAIASAGGAEWQSNKTSKVKRKAVPPKSKLKRGTQSNGEVLDLKHVANAKKGAMPKTLKPQLCSLVQSVPTGDNWFHEVKFDGYRIVAFVRDGKTSLVSRNGKDWTSRFPAIAEACGKLQRNCVIDGEVVAIRPDGTTDFQALQNFISDPKKTPLAYYAFDIVHLDGYDVTDVPLIERKEILRSVLGKPTRSSLLQFSEHIQGNGADVFKNSCKLGLEGVISKQANAPYVQKRAPLWVKVKCIKSQEFVIGGYTEPAGSRSEFGALLLGYYDKVGELTFAGRVGTGFTEQSLRTVSKELRRREREKTAFSNPPVGANARGVHWLKPELICEVEFTEWTSDGQLRHPSFKGLREDKPAKSIVRETPKLKVTSSENAAPPPRGKNGKPARRLGSGSAEVAGVVISNPDKELYPEGITKLMLAEYYESIAERILPYIVNRPLSLVRCPQGRANKCFFQKHMTSGMPEHVRSIPIREKEGKADYIAIDDTAGLIELVNLGVLEFHVWGAREDRIEKPDIMAFDLDPDSGIKRGALAETAFFLRDQLEALGLRSFLKTTGGKGLHIMVPLERRHSWDEVKEFSQAIAQFMSTNEPRRYT